MSVSRSWLLFLAHKASPRSCKRGANGLYTSPWSNGTQNPELWNSVEERDPVKQYMDSPRVSKRNK